MKKEGHERRAQEPTDVKPPSSIHEVVSLLRDEGYDPERPQDLPREFEIMEEIQPNEIKELLLLPYEVALRERDGKIFILTGESGSVGGVYGMNQDLNEHDSKNHSLLQFHTHPDMGVNNEFSATPSIQDAMHTNASGIDKSTSLVLAHMNGMIVYHKPFIDPDTGKKADGIIKKYGMRDFVFEYARKRGVDYFSYGDKNLKQWRDMSPEELYGFSKQFVTDTGMIVEQASWDDAEGIERIMGYINLKRQKTEDKKRSKK